MLASELRTCQRTGEVRPGKPAQVCLGLGAAVCPLRCCFRFELHQTSEELSLLASSPALWRTSVAGAMVVFSLLLFGESSLFSCRDGTGSGASSSALHAASVV